MRSNSLHGGSGAHTRALGAVDGTRAVIVVGLEVIGETGLAHEAAQTVRMVALELRRLRLLGRRRRRRVGRGGERGMRVGAAG